MAIRELSAQEVQNVSGGTFCLLGGLLSWSTSWFSGLFSCGTKYQQPSTGCNTQPSTGCNTQPSTGCYTPPSNGCYTPPTSGCR